MCSQNDDPTQHVGPHRLPDMVPEMEKWLRGQMEFIRDEAQATRNGPNHRYSMREAMRILVFEDRVERRILTPAEARVVFMMWENLLLDV